MFISKSILLTLIQSDGLIWILSALPHIVANNSMSYVLVRFLIVLLSILISVSVSLP